MDTTKNTTFRKDIQFLRAIAVLAVVLFHLDETYLMSGFLGVDVFFVISGYVVTMSLNKKADFFSSKDIGIFYLKRIKRLFPALYFSIFIGLLLAFFLIPPFEHQTLFKTAFYALLASSNFFLMSNSSDYFGVGTDLNPFTHTWSLGLEEQFYFLYPIIFYIIFIKFRKKTLWLLVFLYVSSFLAFLFVTLLRSSEWYYFPFSRFWELLLGAIAYSLQKHKIISRIKIKPSLYLFILLSIVFFFSNKSPVGLVIFITSATHLAFLLILFLPSDYRWINKLASNPVFQLIGDMSYSIYLWHYIIFVIFRWTIGLDTVVLQIVALLLTFAMSYLSLQFFENPFRKNSVKLSLKALKITSFGVLLIFLVSSREKISSFFDISAYTPIAFSAIPTPKNWGEYTKPCHYKYFDGTSEEMIVKCLTINKEKKNLFLVGDSHALQLLFTARKALDSSKVAISYIHKNGIPTIMLENKIPDEIQYILDNANANDILLITFYRGKFYMGTRYIRYPLPLNQDPYKQEGVEEKYKNSVRIFNQICKKANQKNINIILVDDVPQMKLPIRVSSCIFQDNMGFSNSCDIERNFSLHTRKPMTKLFKQMTRYKNVFYWDPHDLICTSKICTFKNNEFIKMQDFNHITLRQAEELAPHFYDFLSESFLIKKE